MICQFSSQRLATSAMGRCSPLGSLILIYAIVILVVDGVLSLASPDGEDKNIVRSVFGEFHVLGAKCATVVILSGTQTARKLDRVEAGILQAASSERVAVFLHHYDNRAENQAGVGHNLKR